MKCQLLVVLFIAAFAWANADVELAEGEEETVLLSLEKNDEDLTEFLNGVELDVAAVSTTYKLDLLMCVCVCVFFTYLRMNLKIERFKNQYVCLSKSS